MVEDAVVAKAMAKQVTSSSNSSSKILIIINSNTQVEEAISEAGGVKEVEDIKGSREI